MDIRKLQRAIVDGLEDVKALNIQVFNTEHLSPLFERVIVASGNSNRQTRALASSVREAVKKSGHEVLRMEGEDNGEWIIVDCGAAVVHVMQPAIRDYYHLEEIWGEKPVKLAARAAKGLVKASEDASAPAKKASKAGGSRRGGSAAEALKNEPVAPRPTKAERRAAAEVAIAPRRAPAKRVSSASPAKAAKAAAAETAPAKKAAPKKAPARKSAAAPVVKKIVIETKKAAPKKSPAAKSAAPAKKAAVARKAAPAKKAAPVKRAAPAAKKASPKKA